MTQKRKPKSRPTPTGRKRPTKPRVKKRHVSPYRKADGTRVRGYSKKPVGCSFVLLMGLTMLAVLAATPVLRA